MSAVNLGKLWFLARSLDHGGAERQLLVLARRLRDEGHDVGVAVFYPGGGLEPGFHQAGIPIYAFHKKGRWDVFGFLRDLVRWVRRERPSVVHAYLTVPNVLSILLKPWVPGLKVVFGVRVSDLERYDALSRWSFRLECRLSRWADLVIANSRAGREYHLKRGFPAHTLKVIPNGIDTLDFRPDPVARRATRADWGVDDDAFLIGLIGRFDPMKDHPAFLQAAARLAEAHPQARFICMGGGDAVYRARLEELARQLGLGGKVLWRGARSDMPAVYPALDLLASSSTGEGFSNVIGEAMAAGVPCVVTDVGDSAWIVGDTGSVVPPGDPMALAAAWAEWLACPPEVRAAAGLRARARIERDFSVDALAANTLAALAALA